MASMTESEAWDAIADTMEVIEGMPEFKNGQLPDGLCGIVAMLWTDGLIELNGYLQMGHRITVHLAGRISFCRDGAWKPRVKWARKFAAEARKEGK